MTPRSPISAGPASREGKSADSRSQPALASNGQTEAELSGRWRKRPVVVDAFRFIPVWRPNAGACAENAPVWFLQAECDGRAQVWGDDEPPYCIIETLEGRIKASAGDWVVRGVAGEIYPVKPDIFAATYEPFANSAAAPSVRLDEHDANEWFDVARKFKPGLTREEFDQQWAEFQAEKQRRAAQ